MKMRKYTFIINIQSEEHLGADEIHLLLQRMLPKKRHLITQVVRHEEGEN